MQFSAKIVRQLALCPDEMHFFSPLNFDDCKGGNNLSRDDKN